MSYPDPHHHLRRWLDAEQRSELVGPAPDSLDPAEEALFGLFAALPGPLPGDGFAERVLARAGLVPVAADLGRTARILTAAALLLTGLAAACFLPWVGSALVLIDASALLASALRLPGLVIQAGVELLQLGQVFAGVGRVLWLVLTSPQVLGSLCLLAGLTALLFRWLVLLIHSDRSPFHAHA